MTWRSEPRILLSRRLWQNRGMSRLRWFCFAVFFGACGCATEEPVADARQEVVFWHFWGGRDRPVVEEIVARFNASQDEYVVRAVAMPGNNLDLKFFLAVAGGDPPDLLNQDDAIVADWAHRGALTPLDELAPGEEVAELEGWLFPAARRLASYDDRLYACRTGSTSARCITTRLGSASWGWRRQRRSTISTRSPTASPRRARRLCNALVTFPIRAGSGLGGPSLEAGSSTLGGCA